MRAAVGLGGCGWIGGKVDRGVGGLVWMGGLEVEGAWPGELGDG